MSGPTDIGSSQKHETMTWVGDETGYLQMIDQTQLPAELVTFACRDVEKVWEAIKSLRVRGAPAIGIAAAYGVVIGSQTVADIASQDEFDKRVHEVIAYLATSRPTAVNLFWALDRMKSIVDSSAAPHQRSADNCWLRPKQFMKKIASCATRLAVTVLTCWKIFPAC